ncbi:MAG: dienelactone hydrolase family protein [Firmicutes bacterium]|nr:dienelactone hydrolase family protein [Bacillota bacterium]MCM1401112.1 dienelactone hydrolase family protein [Bacteroides sp.]MCM1477065.1 dienelactone hydrolase family protein [Bacteroides sp.]
MIKKLTIIFSFLTLLSFTISAAKVTSHRGKVADGYNFWLVEPEDSMEAKPVFIFLHGASLCGNDLNKVRRYGTLDAVEKGCELDAYVIAPQNPGGAWSPKKIMNVLKWVEDYYNVDYDRIYVLGMSLGGYGAIDFAATYPEDVAAAMAFCGGGSVKDLSGLNDVPLWIVHGTADRAVSVSQSDKVVEAMRSADSNTPRLIYDRVPGMNHSQPARLFYLAETYEWLLNHSLKDFNRPVADSFSITDGRMNSAYSGLKSSSKRTASATSVKAKIPEKQQVRNSEKYKQRASAKSSKSRKNS